MVNGLRVVFRPASSGGQPDGLPPAGICGTVTTARVRGQARTFLSSDDGGIFAIVFVRWDGGPVSGAPARDLRLEPDDPGQSPARCETAAGRIAGRVSPEEE